MGKIIHFEIPAFNPEKAITFYKEIFNWDIKKFEGKGEPHWDINTGSGEVDGSIIRKRTHDQVMVNLIEVEDIDSTIEKIEEMDGEIILPKTKVESLGYIIYFKDLDDNVFGAVEKISQ